MKRIQLHKGYKKELLHVWKIAFQEEEEFEKELCKHFFNQEDLWNYTYGWIDNEQLVSTYIGLDVEVLIRNKSFKAKYIDGLATLPSHRGRGLVHTQIIDEAKKCLEQGISYLLLDPSRDSFYRKFGFEYGIGQYRITVDRSFCSQMGLNRTETYTVEADSIAKNAMLQVAYKEMNEWLYNNSRYNEMKWPPCYEDIKFKRDDITIVAVFDESNRPCGYILYSIEGRRMVIESFRYFNLDAFYALKKYMMSLDKEINQFVLKSIPEDFPIDLLITDLGRPEKKHLFGSWISRMVRVVDFQDVLERLIETAPIQPVCIYIKDDIINDNEGYYTISPDGNVQKEKRGRSDVSASITDIVPLLTGLKSARTLYYDGKLKVTGKDTIEQSFAALPEIIKEIDAILPKITTFTGDEYLAP